MKMKTAGGHVHIFKFGPLGLHNDMCSKYIIIYVICFLFQGCASVCHKELCPHPGNWTFKKQKPLKSI